MEFKSIFFLTLDHVQRVLCRIINSIPLVDMLK